MVGWSSFCLCKSIFQSSPLAPATVELDREWSLTKGRTGRTLSCVTARMLLPEGEEAGAPKKEGTKRISFGINILFNNMFKNTLIILMSVLMKNLLIVFKVVKNLFMNIYLNIVNILNVLVARSFM